MNPRGLTPTAILFILVVCLVIAIGGYLFVRERGGSLDWRSYTKEECGFKIKYPRGWEAIAANTLNDDEECKVTFREKKYDLWQADFIVRVLKNPEMFSIDAYRKEQEELAATERSQCEKENPESPCLTNVDQISKDVDTTFQGLPARRMEIFGFDHTSECIQTARGSSIYELCYDIVNPNDPDFKKHRKTTERMLESFNIQQ